MNASNSDSGLEIAAKLVYKQIMALLFYKSLWKLLRSLKSRVQLSMLQSFAGCASFAPAPVFSTTCKSNKRLHKEKTSRLFARHVM